MGERQDAGAAPMAAAVEARAAALLRDATVRWLVKEELAFLLLHHAQLGVPILRQLQLRPTSGRLLLYDTRDAPDFKKDGWHWQKRKDQSGRVREDRAKLVINREVIVLGTYVHSSDVATFHRRSYALRDADPHIVLVHYFDEVNKANGVAPPPVVPAPAPTSSLPVQPAAAAPVTAGIASTAPLTSASQKTMKGLKRALPVSVRPVAMTTMPAAAASALQFPLKPAFRADAAAAVTTDESVDAIMNNCFELDFLQPVASSLQDDSGREPDFDLLRGSGMLMDDGLSDFSDDLLYPLESALPPAPLKLEPAARSSAISTAVTSAATGASVHALTPAQISDFSPDWDFTDGGAKVLICLAAPLPPCPTHAWRIFVQFGILNRVPAEKISDTVVRCTGSKEIYVCCSRDELHPACTQLSSKRSFTYKSHVHASPSLRSSHEVASGKRGRSPRRIDDRDELRHRLGRPRSDRTGEVSNLSSFVDTDFDERQCKIRVVERMSEFHHAIWTTASPGELLGVPESSSFLLKPSAAAAATDVNAQPVANRQNVLPSPFVAAAHHQPTTVSTSTTSNSATAAIGVGIECASPAVATTTTDSVSASLLGLDDSTIETLSDPDLEQLSEQLLERVVRQLVTVAHTSEELLDELNSLDEAGLSLLHYVSFYNYAQLVLLLLSHGAQINQQSTQGQTALHLAAGCGHQDVVDVLVASGADLAALDFGGFTAADRADKSDHPDVAAYLRRLMGSTTRSDDMESGSSTAATPEQLQSASSSSSPPLRADDAFAMDIDDFGVDNLTSVTLPHESTGSPARISDSATESSANSAKSKNYVGENHEHNRKLLLGAFSTMSLHDKCALSLSISRDVSTNSSRRRGSSIGDDAFLSVASAGAGSVTGAGTGVGGPSASNSNGGAAGRSLTASPAHESEYGAGVELTGENDSLCDSDVKSVIADDEERLTKLEAAMALMGPEERQSLEDEVKLLQHNIRAWLLKRNCKHMRETTKRLHEATRSIEDHQQQQQGVDGGGASQHEQQLQQHQDHQIQLQTQTLQSTPQMSERERAAVTVQAATRSMLARKSFLQTKNVTIKVQAATRGVLCRKHFARMKTHALASLVIQRNVREWWYKQQPGGGAVSETSGGGSGGSRRSDSISSASTAIHTIAEVDDDESNELRM